jgi:hypothetical protein
MEFRRSVLDAAIFGVFAVLTYVGGVSALVDGFRFRSWPLAIFGVVVFGVGGLLTYETTALAFGLPTLSFLTNREYLGHQLVALLNVVVLLLVIGALLAHFTVRNGEFQWAVLLIAELSLLGGFLFAVGGGWRVL